MTACFLRAFAATECHGQLQRAHLIKEQTLRRELRTRSRKILRDPRVLVLACQRHHDELDKSRKLRIPRHRLPPDLEEYAAEHGLLWWLTREYGWPDS